MSVLIKGMDMPKSCEECPFENRKYNLSFCVAGAYKIPTWDNRRLKGRNPDCPLVEVEAPHSDLVDRDALLEEWPSGGCGSREWVETIRESIKLATTVITAEE